MKSKFVPAVVISALVLITGIVTYKLLDNTQLADADKTANTQTIEPAQKIPRVTVSEVATGLDHPWEIGFLPSGAMIVHERSGIISKVTNGQKTEIIRPFDLVARGEGGLLGLAIDPDYASNHFIYGCYNSSQDGGDVRVVRRQLDATDSTVLERKDIVVGIPTDPTGKLRHSGCRLAFGSDGNLWIATGDAAIGGSPQDMHSLAGKILRVDREGQEVSGNLGGDSDLRIYSVGHRNVQGLAFYDKAVDGSYGINVEHGTDKEDEINALKRGNFGWNPPSPYSEKVPMTDTANIKDALQPIWKSGENDTIAPSGATFIKGKNWGAWEGRLAVSVLKGKRLMIMNIKNDKLDGTVTNIIQDQGRLRSAQMGPDGSLYLTTDNGSGADKILKVTPTL